MTCSVAVLGKHWAASRRCGSSFCSVSAHSSEIPRSALRGQTADKIYHSHGPGIPQRACEATGSCHSAPSQPGCFVRNQSASVSSYRTQKSRISAYVARLFMTPARICKAGAMLKPATLPGFHQTMKPRVYRRLFRRNPAATPVRKVCRKNASPRSLK